MDSQVFLIATRLAYRQVVHISLLFQASLCLKIRHLFQAQTVHSKSVHPVSLQHHWSGIAQASQPFAKQKGILWNFNLLYYLFSKSPTSSLLSSPLHLSIVNKELLVLLWINLFRLSLFVFNAMQCSHTNTLVQNLILPRLLSSLLHLLLLIWDYWCY